MDGERLLGHLDTADAKSVVFKSDMAGSLTIPWKNVKELHSQSKYAVIEQGVSLKERHQSVSIPQGVLTVEDEKLEVQPAAPASASAQTIPVGNAAHVVDDATFQKNIGADESFFRGWSGAATVGVTLVTATQDNETISSAINLVRVYPAVDWINPVSRTSLNFTSAYGKLTQPGTASVKTSIYHADAERDRYFTPTAYVFGEAAFDHNFSQGLDLAQTFGAGVGWMALHKPNDALDLKAEVDYVDQEFQTAASDQKLIASTFSETYNHSFKHGLVLHQNISFAPAWNNSNAYTGSGDLNLKMPVFKRLSVAIDSLDTFLNDPSPGFKKNSFQFTTGITYSIK